MGDTPGVTEPTLEEQIAAYQREFQDLDPQVEKIVSALSRLNRRMNVAYGRQTADLGISNADWEVLKALVLSGAPLPDGPRRPRQAPRTDAGRDDPPDRPHGRRGTGDPGAGREQPRPGDRGADVGGP
ncbi:hypothetical protein GCM10020295_44940 [Streptomyces cinereospinus]